MSRLRPRFSHITDTDDNFSKHPAGRLGILERSLISAKVICTKSWDFFRRKKGERRHRQTSTRSYTFSRKSKQCNVRSKELRMARVKASYTRIRKLELEDRKKAERLYMYV
jgi:hypothetical protein